MPKENVRNAIELRMLEYFKSVVDAGRITDAARACANARKKYPNVSFEIHDGNSAILWDGFVRGQYDILLNCDSDPNTDFNQIELPVGDRWGVVMKDDDTLASLKAIG